MKRKRNGEKPVFCENKNVPIEEIKVYERLSQISQKKLEKYLLGKFGDSLYDGIRGFIARQDDVLQLKTFEDVFYTMRLDYEGNTFVYNRENAYIDFTSNSYEDTFVPIGELYGGTENWPSPFGGMGLLKTENEQIKTFDDIFYTMRLDYEKKAFQFMKLKFLQEKKYG